MAVPVLQTHTTNTLSSQTSWPINVPAGTVEGDLLIVLLFNNVNTTGWTAPAGWTAGAPIFNGTVKHNVWYRIATASEPASYSWSCSSNRTGVISMLRISGAYQSSPIEASWVGEQTASSTSPNPFTSSSISPTDIDDLEIIALSSPTTGTQSWVAVTSGYTEQFDSVGIGGAAWMAVM